MSATWITVEDADPQRSERQEEVSNDLYQDEQDADRVQPVPARLGSKLLLWTGP